MTHVLMQGSFDKNLYNMIDSALSQNKSIRDLNVSAPVRATIENHSGIRNLEISINTDGEIDYNEDIIAVFQALERNSTIKKLTLRDHSDPNERRCLNLSAESCQALQSALLSNTTIEDLDITANITTTSGCEHFANGLAKNTSISRIKLSMMVKDTNMEIFKNAIAQNKTLKHVDILHGTAIKHVGELFSNSPTIKSLYLRTIDEEFVKNVTAPTWPLEELSLSYDYYMDPTLLVDLLARTTSIKKFSIEIDIRGHSEALGKGLLKNNSVTDLTARLYDQVTRTGVELILDALKHNTTLTSVRSVDYYSALLKSDNVQYLDVLKCNKTLQRLHLSRVFIPGGYKQHAAAIIDALKHNESLTDVNCIDYSVSEDGLVDLFSKNESLLALDGAHANALPFLQRNRQRRQERIILVHNMVRSQHFMALLPRELWRIVFSHVKFPGISSDLFSRILAPIM